MKFDGIHVVTLLIGIGIGVFIVPMLFRKSG